MRRRLSGLSRTAMGFVSGGAAMGIGSSVIGQVGGTTAADSQKALANVASFYPVMGTMAGAGAALKMLKKR